MGVHFQEQAADFTVSSLSKPEGARIVSVYSLSHVN